MIYNDEIDFEGAFLCSGFKQSKTDTSLLKSKVVKMR